MGKPYAVLLRPAARRDLDRLSSQVRERILAALLELEQTPRPRASKQLVGRGRERRLRVGEYRVLYEVDDAVSTVRIFRVRHRGEAYR